MMLLIPQQRRCPHHHLLLRNIISCSKPDVDSLPLSLFFYLQHSENMLLGMLIPPTSSSPHTHTPLSHTPPPSARRIRSDWRQGPSVAWKRGLCACVCESEREKTELPPPDVRLPAQVCGAIKPNPAREREEQLRSPDTRLRETVALCCGGLLKRFQRVSAGLHHAL